ncbi:asparagine--tRNA ligase [Candidatus Phytoplasma prunorum]|uniref:asparagine--tRNA ligase n=1 Tax=Candidatus Phytoplasma prunorum TaxID=47565 RepID=UPI002FEFAFFE
MIVFLKDLFNNPLFYENKKIFLKGWIKNCRFQKKLFFIDFNDGTFINDLQIVCKKDKNFFLEKIKKDLQIGASIEIKGFLVKNFKINDIFELEAEKINILGSSSFEYLIQPKNHSKSFLRKIPHLRLRTKLFGSIFRIRSAVFLAIHEFFKNENFLLTNTPIITVNDGEGAGELFQITTFDLEKLVLTKNKKIDYHKDFFGKKTFLSVTGQLELEALATSLNKVYSFGPIFRADKSNTIKHVAEFWMLEVEMAFYDLEKNMEIIEKMLKKVVKSCLLTNKNDFEFLDKNESPGLIKKLNKFIELKSFPKIKYKEAMEILIKSGVDFEFKPFQGSDFYTEHEKYLTEIYFKSPVFIIDWPKEIKAFYMKINPDGKTVACVDLLVPFVGELVGGSQREENLETLKNIMKELNISSQNLEWYLDLRRFGSCIHSGFGLGFERLLMYLTGIENIRDVIAFPISKKNINL